MTTKRSGMLRAPLVDGHREGEGETNNDTNANYVGGDTYDDDDFGSDADFELEDDDEITTNTNKRRRCTCCGLTKGVMLSQRQYVALIVTVTLVMISVLLLVTFLAIIPAAIAKGIGNSQVSLSSITLGAPDSLSLSLPMTALMSLTNTGSFAADLASMSVNVRRAMADNTFSDVIGSVTMPAMHIDGDTSQWLNSTLVIGDQSAFNDLVRSLINDDTVTWQLESVARVSPMIGSLTLPTYSTDFTKSLTLAGCQGLKDANVTTFSLGDSNETSVNVVLTLAINNPSSFSMTMLGELHFNISFEGSYIGDVRASNVSLLTGINELKLAGQLFNDSTHAAKAQNDLIELYLTDRPAAVTATATTDASSVAMLNGGLQGLALTSVLPGNSVNLVQSLSFVSMSMTPSNISDTVSLNANVSVSINNPMGAHSKLDLQSLSMTSAIYHSNELVGFIQSPPATATFVDNSGSIYRFATSITSVLTLAGDGSAFARFVSQFVNSESIDILLNGNASIVAQYPLGTITATDVPVLATTTLEGLEGLNPEETALTVLASEPHCRAAPLCGVNVEFVASLWNPSNARVELGGLDIQLHYQSVVLGTVTADSLIVEPGTNIQSLAGTLSAANDSHSAAVVGHFINSFIHGTVTTVSMIGSSSSNDSSSAASIAARSLNLTAVVPGQACADNLIQSITFDTFHIQFDGGLGSNQVWVDASIIAAFALPPNLRALPLNITDIDFNAEVRLEDGSGVGVLNLIAQPVTHQHGENGAADSLIMNISRAVLAVNDSDTAGFESFATMLVNDVVVPFHLYTDADPTASSALGVFELTAITAIDTAAFAGLAQFTRNNVSVLSIEHYDIVDNDPQSLLVKCSILVQNPSNVSLSDIGSLTLDLYTNHSRIGRVEIVDMALSLGNTTITAMANISRSTNVSVEDSIVHFMSAMINQTHSDIVLKGGIVSDSGKIVPGTSVPLLGPAIESLVTPSVFPGLSEPFIVEYQATMTIEELLKIGLTGKGSMTTSIIVSNPFNAYIAITNTTVNVIIAGTDLQLGTWYANMTEDHYDPIIIPKTSSKLPTREFSVDINLSTDEAAKLVIILNATINGEPLYLDSIGPIVTAIDRSEAVTNGTESAFVTTIDVDARSIPCVITLG